MNSNDLKALIREKVDFPIPGIKFKDITPILSTPTAFKYVIDTFAEYARKHGATAVLAPESRGFIFGTPVAYVLGIKFVPVRKKGKLPMDTYEVNYDLEYGKEILQIHRDSLSPGDKVIIIDDLIATAGTMNACIDLIKHSQAQLCAIACIISLSEFKEHHDYGKVPLYSLVSF